MLEYSVHCVAGAFYELIGRQVLAFSGAQGADSADQDAAESLLALAEGQVHALVGAYFVGGTESVEVPLTHLSLQIIAMRESVRVHMAVIEVELDFCDAVLVLEGHSQHEAVQQLLCDLCEELLVLFY